MIPDCLAFSLAQIPHVVLAALAIASVVPRVSAIRQRHAAIAFHLVFGVLLLLVPGVIYAPTVVGQFDMLHSNIQRGAAPFHLGFALFNYLNLHVAAPADPVVNFGKAIIALFIVLTNLATAFVIQQTQARGLVVAPTFFSSLVLTNGVWFAVEAYQFFHQKSGINIVYKSWGRTNWPQLVLLADATWLFYHAFFVNAYCAVAIEHHVRREFTYDDFHLLYVRTIACFTLGTAIISLSASHFPLQQQQSYVRQRLVNMVGLLIFFLHGYFISGIYEPKIGHLIFAVTLFSGYIGALSKLHCHVHQEAIANGSIRSSPKKSVKSK